MLSLSLSVALSLFLLRCVLVRGGDLRCVSYVCMQMCWRRCVRRLVVFILLTPLEPQSRFGDKRLKFQVVCPQDGTAVLKGI